MDQLRPRRLRIVNGCDEAIWIAHEAGGGVGPDSQNAKIMARQHMDFVTSSGLGAVRFWPKMRCNHMGEMCGLGGSAGAGQACERDGDHGGTDVSHCAPPVDSRIDAVFGISGLPCNFSASRLSGCDHLNVALTDGYTLPFKLNFNGSCFDKDDEVVTTVDCSKLSLAKCPQLEQLEVDDEIISVNLRAVPPGWKAVVGCYSPCQRLASSGWNQSLLANRADVALLGDYCCSDHRDLPMLKASCLKNGSKAEATSYAEVVRRMCPSFRSFSVDDGSRTIRCSSTTLYELTFYCPTPSLPSSPPALQQEEQFPPSFPPDSSSDLSVAGTQSLTLIGALLLFFFMATVVYKAMNSSSPGTRRPRYAPAPSGDTPSAEESQLDSNESKKPIFSREPIPPWSTTC